jgi:hypothetical protein
MASTLKPDWAYEEIADKQNMIPNSIAREYRIVLSGIVFLLFLTLQSYEKTREMKKENLFFSFRDSTICMCLPHRSYCFTSPLMLNEEVIHIQ